MVLFGSTWYKMLRLCFIAGLAVHLFACIFFQVKSKNENAIAFYSAKNVNDDVSICFLNELPDRLISVIFNDGRFSGYDKQICKYFGMPFILICRLYCHS